MKYNIKKGDILKYKGTGSTRKVLAVIDNDLFALSCIDDYDDEFCALYTIPELERNYDLTPFEEKSNLFKDLTKNLNWVNPDIEKNFTLEDRGITDYKLFHFDRYMSSENAIKEMKKEGYEPANLFELLTWKDWNEKDYVIALGFVPKVDGSRDVPCIDGSGSGRRLSLYWWVSDWDADFRFLGVRKVSSKWRPKEGEKFFMINLDLTVDEHKHIVGGFYDDFFAINNCFRTREEALVMAEKIKELLAKGN